MMKQLSIAQAKSRFSEYIRSVEHGEPIFITRRGKRVAVLVSPENYEQLARLRAAGPNAGLASLAGGWEGSDELVDILQQSSRSEPRANSILD